MVIGSVSMESWLRDAETVLASLAKLVAAITGSPFGDTLPTPVPEPGTGLAELVEAPPVIPPALPVAAAPRKIGESAFIYQKKPRDTAQDKRWGSGVIQDLPDGFAAAAAAPVPFAAAAPAPFAAPDAVAPPLEHLGVSILLLEYLKSRNFEEQFLGSVLKGDIVLRRLVLTWLLLWPQFP